MNTNAVSAVRALSLIALAALSFLVAPQAKATSIDMTPVVATLTVTNGGVYRGISSLALLQDGRLQVVKDKQLVDTIIVPEKALEALLSTAQELSDAKLDEQFFPMVCMAMFPPYLSELAVSGFDFATKNFSSTTRTVLTSDNCDMSRQVRPASNNLWVLSIELRAQLEIIFIQSLK